MFIAVDAMGGDHAPGAVVEGALQAAEEYQVPVLLVGNEESIRSELERLGKEESTSIVIRHATERIEMGESPIGDSRETGLVDARGSAISQVRRSECGGQRWQLRSDARPRSDHIGDAQRG